MNELLPILFNISVVVFMAGNMLDMGLGLNVSDAFRALRNVRFVALALFWGFVVGPGLAYLITMIIPIAPPYAMGLMLIGMTPCAPILPRVVRKANGDLQYTAAFMMLALAATVIFMPIAVPPVTGLTVSGWAIAKPLLMVVLMPMVVGTAILRASAATAAKIQPIVNGMTGVSTLAMLTLCVAVYGGGMLGSVGSLALLSQFVFFSIVTALPYWMGFGLPHEQKIVLCAGMATRNLGAALAPLLSAGDIDPRATIMIVLGMPTMVLFAFLATKWFGRPAEKAGQGTSASAATPREDC
jgi:BASS family bile acid:Na+ symporter